MQANRSYSRHQLLYYFSIYAQETNALLGHLVDISKGGLMVVSEAAFEMDKVIDMRLDLSRKQVDQGRLNFSACAVWGRPASNPGFFETGFRLVKRDVQLIAKIQNLIDEYAL